MIKKRSGSRETAVVKQEEKVMKKTKMRVSKDQNPTVVHENLVISMTEKVSIVSI